MKKIQVILVLSFFSLCFLFLQLYVVKYVSKPRREHEYPYLYREEGQYLSSSASRAAHLSQLTSQSFDNIRVFALLCERMKVPVFLLDPPILEAIMSNVTRHTDTKCKYLCVIDDNLALGILSSQWTPKHDVLGELHKEGFDIITVTDRHPQQSHVDSLRIPEVPTHYMFQRGGHTLHLVVFYERDGGYWWHGPLYGKVKSGDTDDLAVDLTKLKFGKYAGAYDKIDIVKVKMDQVQVYAPRYPTLFLKQIPHARHIECNHTRAKEFYSKYGQDTSEDALRFRKAARNLLSRAKKTLDELEIPFWMSSGTTLGWFRQCDIIPYSRDVDLGIFIKDNDVRLMPAMQMSGMPLKHIFGKPSDSYELSFLGGEVKLDIFFFYEESDHTWNGGTQLKSGKKFKYMFPKFTLCWTEFLDMKIRIPCETQSYIEANYGLNWFEPVKHWDWKNSPPNVRENGVWSKEEWPKVIQEFN